MYDAGQLESLIWQPRSGPAASFAYGYDRCGFVTSRTDALGTATVPARGTKAPAAALLPAGA